MRKPSTDASTCCCQGAKYVQFFIQDKAPPPRMVFYLCARSENRTLRCIDMILCTNRPHTMHWYLKGNHMHKYLNGPTLAMHRARFAHDRLAVSIQFFDNNITPPRRVGRNCWYMPSVRTTCSSGGRCASLPREKIKKNTTQQYKASACLRKRRRTITWRMDL